MNKEVKIKKTKRKLSIQKIFNLTSFTFILACCIFYGSRFIKLYIENNKTDEKEMFADIIKEANTKNENFKNINGSYYFSGNDAKNYLNYSNLTWRIVRINNDNSITLVLDNSITSLAAGKSKNFESSYLNSWLNKKNDDKTGVLENNLNNLKTYLTYTNTCNDTIDDTKNITCKKNTKDIYITVPSINDYVNTGGSSSFMNNSEYFYLINFNSKNKIWYVDNKGKVSVSDGSDIIGIKPIITLKNTTSLLSGDGNKDTPFVIENESNLFGSYVKLDNDIWRIYNADEDNIKLSLNSYLKINNKEITYKYSNNGYYHNDTKSGSLAYYLKNTYLPSLSYKNIVNEVNFSNGIYNSSNNYDYTKTLETTVPTKVATLSIGDIILNPTLKSYYMSTGTDKNSNLVYVMQNDFKLYTKASTSNLKIVPVISIKKELLTKGNGTLESPYEVE